MNTLLISFRNSIILSLTVFLLMACTGEKEPVKIGLSINLSGRGGAAGDYIRDGAMIAVEEINDKGGVKGHPISLIIKDDENTKEGILSADKELIDEGVPVIIGHAYSQSTIMAYDYVTSRNTLLFTPYTGTSRLSGKDDYFIRSSVDTNLYGRALANLLAKRKISTVSFLLDMSNKSFVTEYVDATNKFSNVKFTTSEINSKGEVNWGLSIDKLLRLSPDAIILLTEVTMAGVASQKLRAKGFNGHLIATLWAQTPDLIRYGGEAVEGLSIVTFINSKYDNSIYDTFYKKMMKRFKYAPTARSVRSYEAIYLIAAAMKNCSEFTPEEIKKNLLSLPDFNNIMGPVKFDAFGDAVRPIYEIRISNGKFYNAGQLL
jgi:branched-chain amino acid transport system substrate-binding protein